MKKLKNRKCWILNTRNYLSRCNRICFC